MSRLRRTLVGLALAVGLSLGGPGLVQGAIAHDLKPAVKCVYFKDGTWRVVIKVDGYSLGGSQYIQFGKNTSSEKNYFTPANVPASNNGWTSTFYDGTRYYDVVFNGGITTLVLKHRDMSRAAEVSFSKHSPYCADKPKPPEPTPTPSPTPSPTPTATPTATPSPEPTATPPPAQPPSVTIINNNYPTVVIENNPTNTVTGAPVNVAVQGQLPTAGCRCGKVVKPPPPCKPAKSKARKKCPKLKRGQARVVGDRVVGPSPNDWGHYRVLGRNIERISIYLDGVRIKRIYDSPFKFSIRAGDMKAPDGRLLGDHWLEIKIWYKGCSKPTTVWIKYKVKNLDP